MAPRGGGHGGGGGSHSSGGSSGSRYSSSSSSSSVWTNTYPLGGSEWTEGSLVAGVVFSLLFFLALAGIRIWAGRVKKQHWNTPVWKAVMGKRWAAAIWIGLFFYLWQFIERVLHEERVVVANIYYIFEFILLSVISLAEIFLLLTIFGLLYFCFSSPAAPATGIKKTVYLVHAWGVCGLLTILYIVYFALGIKEVVDQFQRTSLPYYLGGGIPDRLKVDCAYEAIYFVITIEIFAASVFLMVTKTKRGLPTKAVIFLIAMVAFPLFFRKVLLLAFAARFNVTYHRLSLTTAAAEDFLIGFAHMFVYAGVVATVASLASGQQPATTAPTSQVTPQAAPQMVQQGVPPQAQQYPQAYPQNGFPQPPQPGQEIKAHDPGSPPLPQVYYPPPHQQGAPGGFVPQQQAYYPPPHNGYPPQGYVQPYWAPYQQSTSPSSASPPQQPQFQPPGQQPPAQQPPAQANPQDHTQQYAPPPTQQYAPPLSAPPPTTAN